jgi:Nucleotidyltransferase of unknown function (DUF6036)
MAWIVDLTVGQIELALDRVAGLVAFTRERYAIVVVGGAALNLLGIVDRTTTDVDVLAFARPGSDSTEPRLYEPPQPMPEILRRAIATVARDMSLNPDWMNTGPALQWQQGLPAGLGERIQWRHYGPVASPQLGLEVA